jgi:valyl-tRNA synthetase
MLIVAPWPELPESYADAEAAAEIGLVIAVIAEGRSVRAELNVPPSAKPPLLAPDVTPHQRRILEANADAIARLLRIGEIRFDAAADAGAVPFIAEGASLALPVAEFIDLAAERARLTKEVAALDQEIERIAKKLANADFVARAPEEVVDENRERLAEAQAARDRLDAALKRLDAIG